MKPAPASTRFSHAPQTRPATQFAVLDHARHHPRIRIEESTGVTGRPIAEEIRAKCEAEIITQSVHGRSAAASFAEALNGYLETGGRRGTGGSKRFMEPILEHFQTTPLAAIDLAVIERAAKKLYPNASPQTRNRQVFTPIIAVLRHAAARRLCVMPIIARPPPPKGRVRWLKQDEAELLIAAPMTACARW